MSEERDRLRAEAASWDVVEDYRRGSAGAISYPVSPWLERSELTAAVEAVLELHTELVRWITPANPELSFSTREEALDYDDINPAQLEPFSLCAECKRVEDGASGGEGTFETGYLTAQFPCATRRTIDPLLIPRKNPPGGTT